MDSGSDSMLDSMFKELREQAVGAKHPVNRILKIKGTQKLVLQINAVPTNNNIRFSLTLHRADNWKKQVAISPDEVDEIIMIAKFLQKYKDTLAKYIKSYKPRIRNGVVELDLEEEQDKEKADNSSNDDKSAKSKKVTNIDEEF